MAQPRPKRNKPEEAGDRKDSDTEREQESAKAARTMERKFLRMLTYNRFHASFGKDKNGNTSSELNVHDILIMMKFLLDSEDDVDCEDDDSDGWHRKCHDCGASDKSRYVRVQDCCACCLDKCDDCAIQWWTCKNCHRTICRACGNKCDCDNPQQCENTRAMSEFIARDVKETGGRGFELLCGLGRGGN